MEIEFLSLVYNAKNSMGIFRFTWSLANIEKFCKRILQYRNCTNAF